MPFVSKHLWISSIECKCLLTFSLRLFSRTSRPLRVPKSICSDQILDAAVRVLADRGYDGATTKLIAAEAEINEVTLFRRFGNKTALLRAAMEREFARFEEGGGAEYTGDVHADLLNIVELYRQLISRHATLVPVLLAEFRRRPELADVAAIPLRVVHSVARLLERYQDDGALARESTVAATACLLGPIFVLGIGEQSGVPVHADALSLPEHVRRFIAGRSAK